MNLVLMTAFWRERFTSPIRVLLLLTFWGFGLLFGFLKRPVPMPGATPLLAVEPPPDPPKMPDSTPARCLALPFCT